MINNQLKSENQKQKNIPKVKNNKKTLDFSPRNVFFSYRYINKERIRSSSYVLHKELNIFFVSLFLLP